METETAQMEYFLTNYGRCKLEKCRCIDWQDPRFEGAWGGLACPDWETLGAKSFFELIEKVSDERKD
jgi:hypothetical protein